MKIIIITLSLITSFFCFAQQSDFSEKKINIPSEKVTVNGTLMMPKSENNVPLVIIIPGSGTVDRNGGAGNYLKQLAEGLLKNNIATYRYDKSSIVLSKKEGLKEGDISFDDFINDAITVIDYFKDKEQFSSIIVAGHSQGSLVGMVAGQLRIDGFISLAGAGRTIDKILIEQVTAQSPQFKNDMEKTFEIIKSGKIDENFNPLLISVFRKSLQPFWASWIKYNPQEEIKKMKVPILIVNGTKDIQIPVSDAELLHKADEASELLIVENMNHIFKEVKSDDRLENIGTYTNADLGIKQELVTGMVEFINKVAEIKK
ncbi:alpha/beta hydrolase [Aureibaculum sp. 2210JD6-5]|uniref:alpha/beta hydrolase family protein n=1 Tax=Aureibaculum sp. 2210JD6-5 TaxID=3103957 RepID=UPI002AAD069B|nr:alpha/beta hydrolase [Aureibaculum sp. 2210JD6-5]MDY7393652.1 alpha/beta hydrolase [Aureibaculum sp. 2210JD6-5]